MDQPTRRDMLATLGMAPLLLAPGAALAAAEPFSFDLLKRRAAQLARRPYQAAPPVPGASGVDFDAAWKIRFRAERTLFAGTATPVRLFPPIATAQLPIAINIVKNGVATPLDAAGDWFSAPDGIRVPAGFAGFRVMTEGKESDWLAFMGASYFRSSGERDQYGLSARAIAVNVGIDGREEFPRFTEFWLEPAADGALTIYALLDGESLTGAFRFVCRSGKKGVTQDVTGFLRIRRDIQRLGFAPATSMFWYGEGNRRDATDWRPEIHDSDGLAIINGRGERVWRPLANPRRPIINTFADDSPAGFGLLQRDQHFDHYQDDGAFYDRRPGLWITPQGKWGKGAVALYAFPTRSETDDNVVAYWSPAGIAKSGQEFNYAYRLDWTSEDPTASPLARVTDVWTGAGGIPGAPQRAGVTKLVADFRGPTLKGLGRDSGVTFAASMVRGRILSATPYPVAGSESHWRAMLELSLDGGGEPADLRLTLQQGGKAISETLITQLFAGN
ncbi:glucan biosynthesis protein [Sphingomonas quercus]|uniref:Glucan biosynthesis protein n=1 Tax=Sphingomonas quercus TaxID=2842451 RepID=A0ABS6BH55_9SPHN|nr:glucan biosynthesis protein [Sphingomonas quercus]MBU3076570.1 glucan biosynthesis protein [Sphingomonas quercus]